MAAGPVVRRLRWVVLGLVVVLVIAAVVVISQLNRTVKAGIETVGPRIMKVPITVKSVDVSVLRGSFMVEGLEIGNPSGFESPHSFAVGKVAVEVKLPSLLSDEVVIPAIVIEKPDVTLELSGGKTNIGEILKNVKGAPKEPTTKAQKKLRVGVVKVQGATVTAGGLPGAKTVSLPLPDVEVTDFQTGGQAATPDQVVSRTLEALYTDILKAAGKGLLPEQLDALEGELSGIAKSGRQAAGEGRAKVDEAADEVKKQFEGIFGRE